ncbi:54S ribosomal L10, mitochondrial [Lecanosticta acicola]|uniref:54S ribosomal L10, mitochondrial n=1 Tax=Lecanosticta acicola TaxID=111012 RepID=A0AAI9EDA6_9PEZI|nr:54S ribosomal L10, mitochondrial [Lecanosticta acicola]
MPPRLHLLRRAAVSISTQHSYQPIAPFLYPFLHQQRSVSILSSLSDNKGAYNKRIRRGRGPASGKGKTSGRGHKGQKQRGKVPVGFNGGQTPEEVVHGKRGFENRFSVELSKINLNRIQLWIDKGRLDPRYPITLKELVRSHCVNQVRDGGVKLLARGKEELRTPINIIVSRASAEAIDTVEKLGGTVTTRYYTKFAIDKIRAGEMDPVYSLQSQVKLSSPTAQRAEKAVKSLEQVRKLYRYRLPDPSSRKDLEYYRDSAHRGYLSHLVEEGHGPSLYFRTPGLLKRKKTTGNQSAQQKVDNRIW